MILRFISLTLLVCHTARAGVALNLKPIQSSEDLARYISLMATNDAVLPALLEALDSTNTIQPAPYSTVIPVREICGTIIEDRFKEALGSGFFEPSKKQEVREICSFRDVHGEVCRYHIIIFEERQYRLMKALLRQKIKHVAQ